MTVTLTREELEEQWRTYTQYLLVFTVIYNIAEGAFAIGFGLDDEAVSLFGFGIDSLIEVFSSSIVLFHMLQENKSTAANNNTKSSPFLSLEKERRSTLAIGFLLILLCVSAVISGIVRLATTAGPQSTITGIIVSSASLSFMFFLWYFKTKAAVILNSSTLTSDANCSLGCIKLSFILLIGSLLFTISESLWWVDAITAICIGFMVGHEGLSTIKDAWNAEEFSGGCGCCSGSDTFLAKHLRETLLKELKNYASVPTTSANDVIGNASIGSMDTPRYEKSDCAKGCCSVDTMDSVKIDVIEEDACKKGCCKSSIETVKKTEIAKKKLCKDEVETGVSHNTNSKDDGCTRGCCGDTDTDPVEKGGDSCKKGCCDKNEDLQDVIIEDKITTIKKSCCDSGGCHKNEDNQSKLESKSVVIVKDDCCGGGGGGCTKQAGGVIEDDVIVSVENDGDDDDSILNKKSSSPTNPYNDESGIGDATKLLGEIDDACKDVICCDDCSDTDDKDVIITA